MGNPVNQRKNKVDMSPKKNRREETEKKQF